MHTHAASGRSAGSLLFIGLSIATLPLESGLVSVAFGAVTTRIPLSLGLSPSALSPVSDGVPVYTVGDTIWAMSGYNYSIGISVTSPRVVVANTTLSGTEAVAALYTFDANDPDGIWNITLATTQGAVVIPVHFVNPAAHPVSLGPFAYSLSGGNLVISTTANLGDSYDQEVCVAANDSSAGVSLSLPNGMDERGNMTLTPGNPFSVAATGAVGEPFSFWFELYHSYALDIMNTNDLASENLAAADS